MRSRAVLRQSVAVSLVLVFVTSAALPLVAGQDGSSFPDASNDTDLYNCTVNVTESPFAACPFPSICEGEHATDHGRENVGLAFGLTIGAGLSTTIGALLPFVPCIKRSNTKYLAAGLGLAAGVMIYVSFTEIWDESKLNFCCVTRDHYELAAALCFFGGIFLTIALDAVVWCLEQIDCGCQCNFLKRRRKKRRSSKTEVSATNALSILKKGRRKGGSGINVERLDSTLMILPEKSSMSTDGVSTPTAESVDRASEVDTTSEAHSTCQDGSQMAVVFEVEGEVISCEEREGVSPGVPVGNADVYPGTDGRSVSATSNAMSENTNNLTNVSVNELFSNSSLLRMNAIIPEIASADTPIEMKSITDSVSIVVATETPDMGEGEGKVVNGGLLRRDSYSEMVEQQENDSFEPLGPEEFKEVTEVISPDTKRLHRMGLLTCIAIALHNFPEGLATFVATLSSPSLGVALAIAVALHNIPEGVCVAMPVYYATGSRVKAFLWAFLSGISEPIGALMGWLVLKNVFGPLVYGISFGIIGGMMIFISLKELLPTAHRFDKTKGGYLVSLFLVLGMALMSLSIVLFAY